VVYEDGYETSFGHGQFLYPAAVFWDEAAADALAREGIPEQRQWYRYTVKEAGLRLAIFEHHSAEDVLGLPATGKPSADVVGRDEPSLPFRGASRRGPARRVTRGGPASTAPPAGPASRPVVARAEVGALHSESSCFQRD
jgi:hypothetical protein